VEGSARAYLSAVNKALHAQVHKANRQTLE
jgi:hypothetical protein